MPHDDSDKCKEDGVKIQLHVMAPTLNYNTNPWMWSKCSRKYITEFLEYVILFSSALFQTHTGIRTWCYCCGEITKLLTVNVPIRSSKHDFNTEKVCLHKNRNTRTQCSSCIYCMQFSHFWFSKGSSTYWVRQGNSCRKENLAAFQNPFPYSQLSKILPESQNCSDH